jgi:hypothetical protein
MSRTAEGLLGEPLKVLSSTQQRRRNHLVWWLVYIAVLFAGLAIGAAAYSRSYQPYFGLAWGCFAFLLAAWVRFPRTALGMTLALTLIGDVVTVWWFPFAKNLSSWESIMYLSNGVSVSPLEITVVWALAVTSYRNLAATGRILPKTPLLVPFAVFGFFLLLGFVRGVSRGGDMRAAIFEARPLILLPLVYLLVVNVCRTRQDYRRVFAVALAAITLQALLSLEYLFGLSPAARDALESLNQHGAAIGANVVLLTSVSALAYRRVPWGFRLALLAASIPVMWIYIVSQRRAAVVALIGGFILFGVMLFWRQRRTFWKVVPVITLLAVAYTGTFWNSESSAAFPAQAVKTVVAPDQASAKDQSSNLYRILETLNLSATVKSSPVLGIGFGQPFLRPYPLADISVFEFNAYLPHNSFIWVWTKMGFGGFVALLYLIGRTMMQGASRARAAPSGIDAVVALNAVIFVAMYTVFLYVDIGWEARNVFLLAVAMALSTGPLDDLRTQRAARRTRPGRPRAPGRGQPTWRGRSASTSADSRRAYTSMSALLTTQSRARLPASRANVSSSSIERIASRSAAASFGRTYRPVSPSDTVSVWPDVRVHSTARPMDIASRIVVMPAWNSTSSSGITTKRDRA